MSIAETIQRLDYERHEKGLAEQLAQVVPEPTPLTDEECQTFMVFQQWCDQAQVRYFPPNPATVALYVLHSISVRVPPETIYAELGAIERAHDAFGIQFALSQSALPRNRLAMPRRHAVSTRPRRRHSCYSRQTSGGR